MPLIRIYKGGISLVVQWLRLHIPTAKGAGSIPGPGTKTPHAVRHGPQKRIYKRQTWLTFSEHMIMGSSVHTHSHTHTHTHTVLQSFGCSAPNIVFCGWIFEHTKVFPQSPFLIFTFKAVSHFSLTMHHTWHTYVNFWASRALPRGPSGTL